MGCGLSFAILVIGWLQVSPKCDFDRVFQALKKANNKAYIATSSVPVPVFHETSRATFEIQHHHPDSLHRDEESSAPIYNYSRFFSWVRAVDQVAEALAAASENALSNIPVDQKSQWAVTASGELNEANRRGTLDEVERYCNARHLDMEDGQEGDANAEAKMNAGKGGMGVSITMATVTSDLEHRGRRGGKVSRWGSDVWTRLVVASGLALFLQWGTTGGAVVAQVSPISPSVQFILIPSVLVVYAYGRPRSVLLHLYLWRDPYSTTLYHLF